MAEALDDYTATWNEFKLRSDEKQKTADFLNRLKSHDLSQITSMLSIGAGEAEVDYEVIRCSCPRLTRYIAVDPRKEALDVVREKFKQLPQVQVTLVEQTIKTFSGPEQQVDLVFVCNSSYYFRDEYHEQMSRALQWLTPQGLLIDIRDNIEGIPFRQKLKALGAEPGESMRSTQKEFLSWCVEQGWEVDGQVDERDFTVDYSIDISEPGLDQVLKLLVHTLPEGEVDKAKEMMRESVIKGTTRVPGKQLVIIISRAKEEGTSSQSEVPGSGDPSTSSASAGKTSEDAQEKAKQKPEAGRPDEEKNGERSPKVARMDEKADDT